MIEPVEPTKISPETQGSNRLAWLGDVLLFVILLAGAYLRFVGIEWGEYSFMHPDERFMLMVGSAIQPVNSFSQYFNTSTSLLNPHNVGYTFYVYGTLPMFLTRYAAEWLYGHSGLVEMTNVGRPLSAIFDTLVIALVYLTATRLYSRRVGLLAAAFYAAAVLPVQLSHFFKEDTFTNFFNFLAIYFAVRVLTARWRETTAAAPRTTPPDDSSANGAQVYAGLPAASAPRTGEGLAGFFRHPFLWPSLGFGVALGCAVASKLNAAPVALMLPAAMALRVWSLPKTEHADENIPQWALTVADFVGPTSPATRVRFGRLVQASVYLVLAALVSLLVFRVFQPYAFSGPGFLGMAPNPAWVENIRTQRVQSAGDVDFPPAMQWARRPAWFAFENLTVWGLGLPLGLLAWAGFAWAGWRMGRGEWPPHALLWGWTAAYFVWQAPAFNPTMRYFLLIYPTLVIFAAWAVFELVRLGQTARRKAWGAVGVLVGASVLLMTLAWAVAFIQIYIRPFTRTDASHWIFRNIPGPINLPVDTGEGIHNQILPFPYSTTIRPGQPYFTAFMPQVDGVLSEISLGHIFNVQSSFSTNLTLIISAMPYGEQPLATAFLTADPDDASGVTRGYTLPLDQAITVTPQTYYLTIATTGVQGAVDICGPLSMSLQTAGGILEQDLPQLAGCLVTPEHPYMVEFTPQADGVLTYLTLQRVVDVTPARSSEQTLRLVLALPGSAQPAVEASLSDTFERTPGKLQEGYVFHLNQPVTIRTGEVYNLSLELIDGDGALVVTGAGIANEGDWDDALPLRVDNYDGFGGIYPLDLNFNMYWEDTPDKLARFQRILDDADYIVISSNRQWGSLPRLPERFPMTTLYYRNLLGCPVEQSIEWCYSVAQPGLFEGNLGYELIEIFQSNPALGPVEINDQFAEEAFTVYDHPKVLIFRKTEAYDPQHVASLLGSVDFSRVIHLTPRRAGATPADLLLPAERLAEMRQGGTWSDLFDREAVYNRVQVVGVVYWYLALAVLGWVAYPLVRLALPGLPDRGYPLARTAGIMTLAYLVWVGGSLSIPSTRLNITLIFGFIVILSLVAVISQRHELRSELRRSWRYFLSIEGLFLAFFLFDLLIRWANPDLWHQWRGGEKPMDFAYLNAVIKSVTFPPYDPWFAGGYLNYYYYGFVLVGVLVKWLGLVPAFAFNLILPSIFSLIALGAFSCAWNLYVWGRERESKEPGIRDEGIGDEAGNAAPPITPRPAFLTPSPYWIGLAGALAMAVLGNLGTVRMVYQGYQRMAAPGGVITDADIFTRLTWAAEGFVKAVTTDQPLPYGVGDWYWNPSRVMPPPDQAITEFPFFTVLYADPHAHLFAMPVALLAVAWAISVVLGRPGWRGWGGIAVGFFVGGLSIGALYPINLSDIYTYLPLAVVALAYTLWRYVDLGETGALQKLPGSTRRLLVMGGGILLLLVVVRLMYQPYATWYAQGYSTVAAWSGVRTPLSSYLTHWGLFLFVIVTWMGWETIDWMASTPYSALRKLKPLRGIILIAAALVFLVMVFEQYWIMDQPDPIRNWYGVSIIWLVLPLAVWAGMLLLRPGLPDSKRVVLFMVGTALMITLVVDLVVVRGDIERMNTVFKFYLQAWTLLAVSAAAAMGWIFAVLPRWSLRWRVAWEVPFMVLVFGAVLFTAFGSLAKIKDRMVPGSPNTLDGMAYMEFATYDNMGTPLDLNQDYHAIRWMQENVAGSPVIVEAIIPVQYQWFSRFSIYTGLPDVLGWVWHQQQQRVTLSGEQVLGRVNDINGFYNTTDPEAARQFLNKYGVEYVILGQLERGTYVGPGLDKFPALEGELWTPVYQDRDMVIYQVIGN